MRSARSVARAPGGVQVGRWRRARGGRALQRLARRPRRVGPRARAVDSTVDIAHAEARWGQPDTPTTRCCRPFPRGNRRRRRLGFPWSHAIPLLTLRALHQSDLLAPILLTPRDCHTRTFGRLTCRDPCSRHAPSGGAAHAWSRSQSAWVSKVINLNNPSVERPPRQKALGDHEGDGKTARYGSKSGPPTRSHVSRELVRMLRTACASASYQPALRVAEAPLELRSLSDDPRKQGDRT